jgi:energy-coupling factor transporter transmembrane protein EcfT
VFLTFAVLTETGMNEAPRYFVLIWYLIIIIIAVLYEKIETRLYRIILIFSALILVLLSLVNNEWFRSGELIPEHPHIQTAAYLEENGFNVVYATYWNSNILEGLSDGALKAAHFSSAETGFIPFIWAADTLLYYDNSIDNRKIAVVFTDQEEEIFLSTAPQIDLDMLAQAKKITEIADRNIYQFDFNPVTAFKMPKFKGQTEEYFFSKRYAIKIYDNIDYSRRYIDCSAEGAVAWGPYVKVNKGIYKVTVNYEYLKYTDACIFSLTDQYGAEIISQVELPKRSASLTLPNIELKEAKNLLEFVVNNPSQSEIRLKSVVVEKIK